MFIRDSDVDNLRILYMGYLWPTAADIQRDREMSCESASSACIEDIRSGGSFEVVT